MPSAYTIDSGPPGIEARHTWQGLIALNNISDRSNGHIKLTNISGLHGIPDAPDNSAPHKGRRGTYPYPTQPKSKTVQYTGVVRAKTLEKTRRLANMATNAFRDRNTEGVMVIAGVAGGPSWWFRARPQACEIPDEQTNGPDYVWKWERAFDLQLMLYDPRIYLGAPETPLIGGATGTATINNPGRTDSDPIFYISAFAGGDLEFQNDANQRLLRFEDLPSGDLVCNFYRRTIIINNVEYSGHMHPNSDWWDESVQGLLPGNNTLHVYGDGGATFPWGITWHPAVEA